LFRGLIEDEISLQWMMTMHCGYAADEQHRAMIEHVRVCVPTVFCLRLPHFIDESSISHFGS
jgi:hypothetical protein